MPTAHTAPYKQTHTTSFTQTNPWLPLHPCLPRTYSLPLFYLAKLCSTPVCRRFYLQTHRTLGLLSFGLLVYYLSVGLLVLVTFVVVMRRYVAQHLDLVTTLRDLKW